MHDVPDSQTNCLPFPNFYALASRIIVMPIKSTSYENGGFKLQMRTVAASIFVKDVISSSEFWYYLMKYIINHFLLCFAIVNIFQATKLKFVLG